MPFPRLQAGIRGMRALAFALCAVFPAAVAAPAETAGAAGSDEPPWKWSVQYLIDNSQPVAGRVQTVFPRRVRGLALSPDGHFLYAAYAQSFNDSGEVRKIDTRVADYESATVAVLPGHRVSAIAVDDEGRVYLAEGKKVTIFDAGLSRCQQAIQTGDCQGVAVTRESGSLVLYGTDRRKGTLSRWTLRARGGEITGAARSGEFAIPGAQGLTGVAVDAKGRIWMADTDANRVFRVERDGRGLQSASVPRPVAIAFDEGQALVTCSTRREIAILDMEMNIRGTLAVPWEELRLSPSGMNQTGALSGIAALPGGGGFFVANESGQTAGRRSTYGRTDQNSDTLEGTLFTDAFTDDNEPILRAAPVKPGDAAPPLSVEKAASPAPDAPDEKRDMSL